MALATTTTPGSIILGGDLTGNANAPELRITGVTAGSYTNPTIVVDAKGRVIYSANGSAPVLAGDVSGSTTNAILPNVNLDVGTFIGATITVNAKGFITAASNTTLSGDVSGNFNTLAINPTGVTAGSYVLTSLTVNSKGLITSATDCVFAGSMTGTAGSTTLSNTGVTAGSYAAANVSINAEGRVTAASNASTAIPDATYAVKGLVSVQTNGGISVSAGSISITTANGTGINSAGRILVNPTTYISLTAGKIELTSLVPKLNQSNTFTAAINGNYDVVTTSSYTPNLALTDIGKINRTSLTTINAPTNVLNGQSFEIFGDGYDATTLISTPNNIGGTDNQFTNFIWTGTYFFAIGASLGPSNRKTAISTDGINWTIYPTALPSWDVWTSVAWSGTQFCAIVKSGSAGAATSPDGINWTARSLPSGYSKHSGIAWNGSVFATIVDGDTVFTSPDGITWTTTTLPVGQQYNWVRLIAGGGEFVTITKSPSALRYLKSTNGTTWSGAAVSGWPEGMIGNVGQPAFSGGIFVWGLIGPFGLNALLQYDSSSTLWSIKYLTTSNLSTTPDTAITVFSEFQFFSFAVYEGTSETYNKYVNYDPVLGVSTSTIRTCSTNIDVGWGAVVGNGKIVFNNFTYTPSYAGLSFDSTYKFSNSLTKFNAPYTIDCVHYNGTSYCTYN